MYSRIKRVIDVMLAALLLVATLPLLLLGAGLVLATMGRPVLYRQVRTGRGGRLFLLLKLRTMRSEEERPGRDGERLTPIGRWLRRTSIDELPQLVNVIRGDMSLVGPRPLLPQYLGRYSPEQARRHEVEPGLTGLAQVRGRNGLTWQERFALDVWYVDHRSPGLDLAILAQTVWTVLSGRGISAGGHDTMPEFLGDTGAEEERCAS
jgi:lipopolysaccharide/colanic/teichoic acid biosynthesis glycosyltransferase